MQPNHMSRRNGFIGGSDARIIMGNDEAALHRLWREKRGRDGAGRPVGQSASSSSGSRPNT